MDPGTANENTNGVDNAKAPTALAGPQLSADCQKVGGQIKQAIDDFVVQEVPAYEPSGEGPHYYLWVEARDVDGRQLLQAVAKAFDVRRRDIGTAGTKDRRAVTRQWVSLPAQNLANDVGVEPGPVGEGLEILAVSRHTNKLRTGHLKGNQFTVILRDTDLRGESLMNAVEAIAERIDDKGLPNYYGSQRFGNDSSNLEAGWQWVRGGAAPKSHFMRRMAASAFQSEVFNRLLTKRLCDETWKRVLPGDIFMRCDSGGRFWISSEERAETSRRLADREIVVTGPMPGSQGGLARDEVRQIELDILGSLGVDEKMLGRFKKYGRGTRRPLTVYVDNLSFEKIAEDAVALEFFLPAGSYATVLLAEFIGTQP